jgi:hypothetical protein
VTSQRRRGATTVDRQFTVMVNVVAVFWMLM